MDYILITARTVHCLFSSSLFAPLGSSGITLAWSFLSKNKPDLSRQTKKTVLRVKLPGCLNKLVNKKSAARIGETKMRFYPDRPSQQEVLESLSIFLSYVLAFRPEMVNTVNLTVAFSALQAALVLTLFSDST